MSFINSGIAFFSDNFMPHGHCYLWNPTLLRLEVISNLIIAIAYYMIPFALIYFVQKRKDLVFKLIFVLFGIFIISCGTTHILDIITIWYPYYWIDAYIRVITALVSISTGILLLPMIPKAIALPSPSQLQTQINERIKAEEAMVLAHKEVQIINNQLEQRVEERTNELLKINEQLKQEISERKRVEKELIRANEDLQQFMYIASHDLQEPIRMVTNYTQLLNMRYKNKLDEEANEFIGFASEGAKRMHLLINDVLSFLKVSKGNTSNTEIDLNLTVKNVIENLKEDIDKTNIEIDVKTLPVINGDRGNMLILFQHLIANSIKYHGNNNPKITIFAIKNENEWIFSVNDNGIGISKEYFDKIFVMFQRLHTRDKYEGTGIGLAICKKIVEQYGGKIWVESEENTGTTFFFTLPIQ